MKDFMNWFNPLDKEGSPLPDNLMDMTKMNEFVQKSIEEALNPSKQSEGYSQPSFQKNDAEYKVVELMREVVVTIGKPIDIDIESIRLSVGNGKLFVDGFHYGRLTIPLPAHTSRRNIYAQYNDGIIEVRLPKKNSDEKEIFLHY